MGSLIQSMVDWSIVNGGVEASVGGSYGWGSAICQGLICHLSFVIGGGRWRGAWVLTCGAGPRNILNTRKVDG